MGGLSDVRGVGRRRRRRRGHGDRLGRRPPRDGRRQRRDRQGGRVLPDDDQEDSPRPDGGRAEPSAAGLSRRLVGCLPADARRGLSRRGRFRADLSQQRGPLGGRHSPVRGHHGQLRRRRSVFAGPLRHRVDDRGLGPVPGGSGAGEGGHRPGDLERRARRCARPRGHQRHGRLSRAGRRRVPGPPAAG